jgi:GAF domain
MKKPATDIFSGLHARCAAFGARLFTLTALDQEAALFRRVYSSHPVEYPVSGTKPVEKDGWYAVCIMARQSFVANAPEEFAPYFFDHALIASLGLGSCLTIPVHDGGPVLGTVNLLSKAGHCTPERVQGYEAMVLAVLPDLCRALPKALHA